MWATFALGLLAATPLRAASTCTLARYAELPVTMAGIRPMITGSINGETVHFLADSGAFFSMLSSASAERLHLRPHALPFGMVVGGVGGTETARAVTVKAFSLDGFGGRAIPNVDFVVGGNAFAAGDGIIGQNILGTADTEYDLGNGVIRLFHSKGCADAALAYWHGDAAVAAVDLEMTTPLAPHLIGRARLDGRSIRVVYDSGASWSILSLRAATRAGFRRDDAGATAAGLTHGLGPRQIETWIARFDELDLGGELIRNARLRVGDLDIPGDADLLLGADFFLSHRIYVSTAQHRLFYTYNGGRVFDLRADTAGPAAGEPATADAAPGDAAGYRRRGAAFAARGQFTQAIADFDQAIRLEPEAPENYFQRGITHRQNHQPELALGDFDADLRLKPDDVPALLERGALRLERHDDVGAGTDFDAALQHASQDAGVALQVAQAYSRSGHFEEAIRRLDAWIQSNPRDERLPGALTGRCWSRVALGQGLDLALADCNAALRQGPRNSQLLDTRALVWLRLGRFDRSMADFRDSLKLQPRSAWSLYGLGLAERGAGMQADAERDLQAASALGPEVGARYGTLGLGPGPHPP